MWRPSLTTRVTLYFLPQRLAETFNEWVASFLKIFTKLWKKARKKRAFTYFFYFFFHSVFSRAIYCKPFSPVEPVNCPAEFIDFSGPFQLIMWKKMMHVLHTSKFLLLEKKKKVTHALNVPKTVVVSKQKTDGAQERHLNLFVFSRDILHLQLWAQWWFHQIIAANIGVFSMFGIKSLYLSNCTSFIWFVACVKSKSYGFRFGHGELILLSLSS